jgi:hypothetical protein
MIKELVLQNINIAQERLRVAENMQEFNNL